MVASRMASGGISSTTKEHDSGKPQKPPLTKHGASKGSKYQNNEVAWILDKLSYS